MLPRGLEPLFPLDRESVADTQIAWPMHKRFVSRLIAVFTLLAVLTTYDPLIVIPFCGMWISSLLDTPLMAASTWTGIHLFHLSGVAATQHPTDSRDTALGWTALLLVSLTSLLIAMLWSALDANRHHDEKIVVWARYILRIFLSFVMIRYGVGKIFPLQMSRPSLAVLNEPLGQSSPMTLLWTLVGLSPAYQISSGVLEAISGVLLLFKRTALVGALIGFIVMVNVTLLNLCFDVPVKLGALLISFALTVIIAPDVPTLLRFFLKQAKAELFSLWEPQWRRQSSRNIAWVLQAIYVLCFVYFFVPSTYSAAHQEAANRLAPSSLTGGWRVESAQIFRDAKPSDGPVLTAEGLPMTALYFEPDGRVMARSSDGRLWRAGATIDTIHRSVSLYSGYFKGVRFDATYTYSQVDNDHIRLEPEGEEKASHSTLLLTRMPEPHDYPLLQTPFRWVHEWALER